MQLQVYMSDKTLMNKIAEKQIFEKVFKVQGYQQIIEDYILLSDQKIHYQELEEIDELKGRTVFYLLENTYEDKLEKAIRSICNARGIHLIPPRLTDEQIIGIIEKNVQKKEESVSNVVTFTSPLSNIGKTSTTLSTAMFLKENTNNKIGVLMLDAWDSGVDQIDYKGQYLDRIKGKLTAKLLGDDSEFLSLFHMIEKDSLYILAGNTDIKMERLFTTQEINYLIQRAKSVFDIALIDAGNHFDNANIVQALHESDLKFLLLTQQSKAIRKFNQCFEDVLYPLGYTKEDFLLIINQYENKSHYPTKSSIIKDVDVPFLTAIEKTPYGITSEMEQKILYTYEDADEYRESIHIIGSAIAAHTGIKIIEKEEKKKTGFFAMFK